MASSFTLEKDTVKTNIEALQKMISASGLDGFYVSSFDPFLNEYVPMEDCHRFYITNFSGSVAETFVPAKGRVKLYVDGRYYEQADVEVDATLVEVVRVPANTGLSACMLDDIKSLNIEKLGIEAPRTPLSLFKKLKQSYDVHSFKNELHEIIDFKPMPKLNPIKFVPKELRGYDTKEKLDQVIPDKKTGYYITAIDSLSWITNCRGFHLPNLASFLGRGFAVHDKVYVYIDPTTELESSAENIDGVEFVKMSIDEVDRHLRQLQKQYALENLYIQPKMLNASDYAFLLDVFGEEVLNEKSDGLVEYHSIKSETEIKVMKEGFKRGDKAIYNTIKWVKDNVAKGEKVSEYDLWAQTTKEYQAQGSQEQSFNTIAGCGANGALIHYGDPKKDIFINKDDMVLMDSGGYFDGGFATDTTRTFMGGEGKVHPDYIKMYTLVLKGTLQCQHAVFPKGARGATLDAYARKSLFDHGYDFKHGTGHGVGIHVHEDGVRISPVSQLPMKAGQVVSIEPGLYLPGFAGVRIENIALVKEHPKFDGFLCFEPLVYIGYEPQLIDEDMLTRDEKIWLEDYEKTCKERGTSFR